MSKKKGELIIKAEPYVHVLCYIENTNRCSYCCLIFEKLKTCAACGLLKYCGVQCQKADWSIHKLECSCYKQTQPKIPTDSVRLFLRIILRHLKSEDEKLISGDPGWRCFSELESHSLDIQRDEKRLAIFSQTVFTLNELTKDIITLPPTHSLFSMFGKMLINTFSICDDDLQPIGCAIYNSPSLLDHSCDPNAVSVFTGKTLSITAIKDIPDSSPNKISLSYIDQLKPSAERIGDLQEQYYFTCQCLRCQNTELDELMYSVRCNQKEDNCTGLLAITSDNIFELCSVCRCENIDEDYLCRSMSTIEIVDKSIQQLEDLRKSKEFSKLLSSCDDCIQKYDILSDCNIYYVRMVDLAFDACINLQLWKRALEYGLKTIEPYEKYYPGNTPNLSIQFMKVGKIQLFLERTEEALTNFHKAEKILKITHGSDDSLYQTLSTLISQCIEELRHKIQDNTS